MSSNPLSLLEQIKAMSCEDRNKILNLLNEKQSILVKPLNFEIFENCHLNSNPYNLKSYQKPVCPHQELIAPRYYCIICKELEKQQKREDDIKLNQKPVCPHKTLLAPDYYCTFCSYKEFIDKDKDKDKDKVDTELFNNVAIEKFFSSL